MENINTSCCVDFKNIDKVNEDFSNLCSAARIVFYRLFTLGICNDYDYSCSDVFSHLRRGINGSIEPSNLENLLNELAENGFIVKVGSIVRVTSEAVVWFNELRSGYLN